MNTDEKKREVLYMEKELTGGRKNAKEHPNSPVVSEKMVAPPMKDVVFIAQNDASNNISRPVFMGNSEDSSLIPLKAVVKDIKGNPVEVEVMVSAADIQEAATRLDLGQADFDRYITKETFLEKYSNITDGELKDFFSYLPEEMSEEMVLYMACYAIMKINDESMTFSKIRRLVGVLESGGLIEMETDEKTARMYKAFLEMSSESIVNEFNWITRKTAEEKGSGSSATRSEEEDNEAFRRKLTENMRSKTKNIYGKRSEGNKMVAVSLSAPLRNMVLIAKTCYKGNLTAFISSLIIEDARKHGKIYDDVLKDCLSKAEYNELVEKLEIKSIAELVEEITAESQA